MNNAPITNAVGTEESSILAKTKEFILYITTKELIKLDHLTDTTEAIKNENDILQFIKTLQYQYKLHTLLTPRALYELTNTIFTNERVRDFVLSGSDELAILLSENSDDIKNLTSTILNGLYKNRHNHQGSSCIPEAILAAIQLDINIVDNILNDNFWLIFIIGIYLFMPLE